MDKKKTVQEVQKGNAGKIEIPMETQVQDSVYSVDEFAAGAQQIFGISQDIVRAALNSSGIKECTKAEAEKVVKAFAERKVK